MIGCCDLVIVIYKNKCQTHVFKKYRGFSWMTCFWWKCWGMRSVDAFEKENTISRKNLSQKFHDCWIVTVTATQANGRFNNQKRFVISLLYQYLLYIALLLRNVRNVIWFWHASMFSNMNIALLTSKLKFKTFTSKLDFYLKIIVQFI